MGNNPSAETRAKLSEAAKNRAPMSEETRAKIGAASKGHKESAETRMLRRENVLRRIEQRLPEGGQVTPGYNSRACEWFTQFDAAHNTEGIHATNGGEYRTAGYFLDYINHDLQLIIEWDEEDHYKEGRLRDRDVRRQIEIEELHPSLDICAIAR